MPRIYSSANNPLDFCITCFPKETLAKVRYGNEGPGPDDRGNCFDYDADHPPYENEDYVCRKCLTPLTEGDNCV